MAFRRKFPGGRRSFRRPFRRAPVARVRRTWITALGPQLCNFLEVPLEPCQSESQAHSGKQFRLILVNNSVLESSFSDRARAVRILGDMWFQPTWDGSAGGGCVNDFGLAAAGFVQMFLGLRKYETNSLAEVLNLYPLDSDVDLSEGQWLKTWQHMWVPQVDIIFDPGRLVKMCGVAICPDVHTAGALDNDFVDGTGTINIETDCGDPQVVECEQQQDASCTDRVTFPRAHHIHFDVKKRIALREDQELAIEGTVVMPGAAFATNPRVQMFGNLRVLMQF